MFPYSCCRLNISLFFIVTVNGQDSVTSQHELKDFACKISERRVTFGF